MWGSRSILEFCGGFIAGQSKWPTSGFWAVGAIAGCGVWTLVERNRGLVAEGQVLLNFPGAGQFLTLCLDIYYPALSGEGMRMRTCRYSVGVIRVFLSLDSRGGALEILIRWVPGLECEAIMAHAGDARLRAPQTLKARLAILSTKHIRLRLPSQLCMPMLKSFQRPCASGSWDFGFEAGTAGKAGWTVAIRPLVRLTNAQGASGDFGGAFQKAGLAASPRPRAGRPGTG